MKIGIMQPYIFPYLGYFQLIKSVDKYVVLDDVQYIKGGWINRNRILFNGTPRLFTFSVKHGSFELNINERYFTENFEKEQNKFLRILQQSYRKAPCFEDVFKHVDRILSFKDRNVSSLITNSLIALCNYLDIKTPFIISSQMERDRTKKQEDMVIDIVKRLGASDYINAIGGQAIYSKEYFKERGVQIKFLKTNDITYKQFNKSFVPNLSIIDVLMFNSKEEIAKMLDSYTLIQN